MINVQRIDHINMKVRSFAETLPFYKELFGFKEKERGFGMDAPYVILGLADKVYLCIYEVGDQPLAETGLRLNHFGMHVEDFDGVKALLEEKDVPLIYGGVVDYDKSRSLYITDPSGFVIELTENAGGGLH